MQYLILALEDSEAFDSREDQRADDYWSSWRGYLDALTDSGVLVDARGLHPPSTATTLRLRDGRRLLQDGPYADSKEQLGGYFVLEVPTLDAALEWAERCPAALAGSVEVRPVLPPPAG